MGFDTKVAVVLDQQLAVWQKASRVTGWPRLGAVGAAQDSSQLAFRHTKELGELSERGRTEVRSGPLSLG
jgi:hypothetical protein